MAVDRVPPQEVRERLSVAALRRCRPGRTDPRRGARFTRQSAGSDACQAPCPPRRRSLPRTSRTVAGQLGRRSASRSGARTAPPAARADAASCQTDAVGPPRAHIAGTRRDASPGPPRTRSRTRRRPQRASGTRSAAGTPAPSQNVSAPPVAWNRATAGPFPDGQSSARPARPALKLWGECPGSRSPGSTTIAPSSVAASFASSLPGSSTGDSKVASTSP